MIRLLVLITYLQLWNFAPCASTPQNAFLSSVASNVNTLATGIVETAEKAAKKVPILNSLIASLCVEPEISCPNENVTFWYYTRSNRKTPLQLFSSNISTSSLSNDGPWKIIIHGYTKSKDEIPNPQLQSAYFKRGNYNIISVDYEPLARDKCYIQAVHNVPLIAKCTAELIDALVDKEVFRMSDLHTIGFSLGAQIVGQLHQFLRNGRPGRVTGLDPASPLFDGKINEKLSEEAGDFVDVIHTNALVNGKLERSGSVDFYVNGGLTQPGCIDPEDDKTSSTCSHERGPRYFAESINSSEGFWGIPCSSYVNFLAGLCKAKENELVRMGEDIPKGATGSYYLQTTDHFPFALGKKVDVIA